MTVLLAFTLEHAACVTGLTESRIRYWDTTRVVQPSLVNEHSGGAYSRIYSFRDLVALRTVADLRQRFGVSLQKLRAVGDQLRAHSDSPWSEFRFYVSGKELFFRSPESPILLSALRPGQIALAQSLDLEAVVRDTQNRSEALVNRGGDQVGKIISNRYVFGNRPVIAGTRIPTVAIWDFHEDGYSVEEILEEYPRLTRTDVEKAIEFELERRQIKRAS